MKIQNIYQKNDKKPKSLYKIPKKRQISETNDNKFIQKIDYDVLTKDNFSQEFLQKNTDGYLVEHRILMQISQKYQGLLSIQNGRIEEISLYSDSSNLNL